MLFVPVVAGFALASVVAGIAGLVSSIRKAVKSSRVKPNPVMSEVEQRLVGSQRPSQRPVPTANTGTSGHPQSGRDQIRESTTGEQTNARTDATASTQRTAVQDARPSDEHTAQAAERERRRAIQESPVESTRLQEAEWKRQAAENQAAQALVARERAEMKLREGVRPMLMPTLNEFKETKKRVEYKEGWFHFAVVGTAGSGKSSLVNALRGLRNNSRNAARTGTSETTMNVTRYADANDRPFVWYDVPGAGTINVPDWKYFVDQGLYVFDAIIVLCGERFTETDIAILRNCSRWRIPAYIARSKADMHIMNIINDSLRGDGEGEGEEEEEDEEPGGLFAMFGGGQQVSQRFMEARDRARGQYIKSTREDVKRNLAQAELPEQRVYIVGKDALVAIVKGKEHPDLIDEPELYRDLLTEVDKRRIIPE